MYCCSVVGARTMKSVPCFPHYPEQARYKILLGACPDSWSRCGVSGIS